VSEEALAGAVRCWPRRVPAHANSARSRTRSSAAIYLWTESLVRRAVVRARPPAGLKAPNPGKASGRSTPSPRWSSNSRRRARSARIGALGDPRAPPAETRACIRLLHAHRRLAGPAGSDPGHEVRRRRAPPPDAPAHARDLAARTDCRAAGVSLVLTALRLVYADDAWASRAGAPRPGPRSGPRLKRPELEADVLLRSSRVHGGARDLAKAARERGGGLRIGEATGTAHWQARAQKELAWVARARRAVRGGARGYQKAADLFAEGGDPRPRQPPEKPRRAEAALAASDPPRAGQGAGHAGRHMGCGRSELSRFFGTACASGKDGQAAVDVRGDATDIGGRTSTSDARAGCGDLDPEARTGLCCCRGDVAADAALPRAASGSAPSRFGPILR